MTNLKFEFEEKEVVYNIEQKSLVWGTINGIDLKALNVQKYNSLMQEVHKEIEKNEEAKKAKEEEEKRIEEERVKQLDKVFEAYKAEFSSKYDFEGYEVKHKYENNDRKREDTIKDFSIKKDGVDADISYDAYVYSGNWSMHKSRTSSPWVVCYDYKRTRYATLEKAIAKAKEKIENKLAERKVKKEAEEKRQKENNDKATELGKLGLSLFEETKSSNSRRGGCHSYKVNRIGKMIKTVKEDKYSTKVVSIKAEPDRENTVNKVVIKGDMTEEQLSKLVKFVEDMDLKPVSDW